MSAGMLAGRRIVITRPEVDAGRLAARLRRLGATPIIAPAIEIEFTDPPALDQALRHLHQYDWIIFTSKNGVEAVFRRDPPMPTQGRPGPRIAAIGPATAQALRDQGVEPDLIPARFIAEAILEGLGDVRGLKVLLPRADLARPALPEGLRARGAEVEEIAAYRTRSAAPDRAASLGRVDAVTFTSSSTVRGFLESGPMPAGAKVICIGPITAATAREYGLEVAAVADTYTEDGLITALLQVFSEP